MSKPIKPKRKPTKRKPAKPAHPTTDYLLLSVPENPGLFAVQRRAVGAERFVKADPDGTILGPVYDGITYLVSPFLNYETGLAGESCTCLSWRVRNQRCVHLQKFHEMNPEFHTPDIFEDTILDVVALAETVAADALPDDKQKRRRTSLVNHLLRTAVGYYHADAGFRKQLAPCRKTNPADGSPVQAKYWLLNEMAHWTPPI